MTADLALRILILVAGIIILWVTTKTDPSEAYEAGFDKYIMIVLSVIIIICGLIGVVGYFVV